MRPSGAFLEDPRKAPSREEPSSGWPVFPIPTILGARAQRPSAPLLPTSAQPHARLRRTVQAPPPSGEAPPPAGSPAPSLRRARSRAAPPIGRAACPSRGPWQPFRSSGAGARWRRLRVAAVAAALRGADGGRTSGAGPGLEGPGRGRAGPAAAGGPRR